MMKLRFIHINTYNRPLTVNPHVHNVYEFVYYINAQGYSMYGKSSAYIESGQFLAYTDNVRNGDVFYFGNNSYILYPPGTVHDEHHQIPAKLVAVGFVAEDFPMDPAPKQFKDFNLSVFRLIEKIADEYRDKNYLYNKVIEATLTEFFVTSYRSRGYNPLASGFDPIEYAYIYINEYFSTEIDLEKLANSTVYSNSRFRELFKSKTGISPKHYILNKRIEYAEKLLTATKLPIKEIAFLCGFTDYPQFNKFFKARKGINPKNYRHDIEK